jgi:predicted dehydrogenase
MAKRVVRIGVAGMTSDHFWYDGPAFAALPSVTMVSGAEPQTDLRQRAQAQFDLKRVYEHPREMFEHEDLDGVLVYSDNASKADIVDEAAQRGVHVYLDKPMAATLEQADRIVAAVERHGIKLMIQTYFFFDVWYGKAKQWLDQGWIGDVFLARAIIGHAGPKELGCSEHFCQWLFNKELNGGGAFVDEGFYAVSAFLDHLGPVTEVSAMMAQTGSKEYLPPGVEDSAVVTVRFANGALGIIDASWAQIGTMPFHRSYHGAGGTVVIEKGAARLYSRKAPAADPSGWVEVPLDQEFRQDTGDRISYFANCILEDWQPAWPLSAQGGRATQEVIEAAYRSARSGEVVRLPVPGGRQGL